MSENVSYMQICKRKISWSVTFIVVSRTVFSYYFLTSSRSPPVAESVTHLTCCAVGRAYIRSTDSAFIFICLVST